EHAFVQRFETGAGGSGADVIAVDAVEALRGVLIEPGARPAEPATKPEASVPKMPPKSSPAEPVEPTPGAGESRPITPFEIPWAHSFSAVLRAAPNVGLEAQG